MTSISSGDVGVCRFPFTDESGAKARPAVVVSSAAFHRRRGDLIILAITGRTAQLLPEEALIQDWHQAGLIKPSALKAVIGTVHHRLVLAQLGSLTTVDREALGRVLRSIIASDLQASSAGGP